MRTVNPEQLSKKVRFLVGHIVIKNILALGVIQAVNYVIPLILIPFLTRKLGLQSYGLVAVALSIIQFAFVLTDYGFSLSATYSISLNRNNKLKLNEIVSSIVAAKLILIIISFLILFLITNSIDTYKSFIRFLPAIFFSIACQALQPIWLFQGLEKMSSITIYSVMSKLLYVILVLLSVNASEDSVYVIWSWGISHFVAMIISLILMYKGGIRLYIPAWSLILREFKDGAQFFWSRVSVAIYTSLSVSVVGSTGMIEAAKYSICEQIYKAGQNITSPISTALYPYMVKTKNWKVFYKLLATLGIGIVLLCTMALPFTSEILSFIFGTNINEAGSILKIFLVMTMVNYFTVFFGYPAFGGLNKIKVANVSVIFGGLVQVLGLSVLAFLEILNAYNVALMVLITEALVFLIRFAFFIHYKNNKAQTNV